MIEPRGWFTSLFDVALFWGLSFLSGAIAGVAIYALLTARQREADWEQRTAVLERALAAEGMARTAAEGFRIRNNEAIVRAKIEAARARKRAEADDAEVVRDAGGKDHGAGS